MPKLKLTETAVRKIRAPDPSGRQRLHWDTELTGFGVLVSGKTAAKTYVVQREVDGRSRRVTIAPVNVLSLEKARKRAKGVLADMYGGVDPRAKRQADKANATTLRQALEAYLAFSKKLRERTRIDYRKFVELYLEAWLDKPLREITPEMVEARHAAIKQEVEDRKQSAMAKGHSAANMAMRVLRLIWNHAAERMPLPDNPVRRLRRGWYPEKRRKTIVKKSDLAAFYQAIMALPNTVQRDYILCVLFTGLRLNEAAAMRWDEIDLTERMIRIPESRTKSGETLDLPMSDFLHDLFVARRSGGGMGPWVFPANSNSGHISEPKFALRKIEKETGIKATVHDLRRTYITVAESCDISVYALKGLVNHSMGKDVTAEYIVAGDERLREPQQKVTDKLKVHIGLVEPEGVEKLTTA